MTLGEKIKQARLKAGLSQKNLGTRLGVTNSIISYYESDKRKPSTPRMETLCKVLKIEMN